MRSAPVSPGCVEQRLVEAGPEDRPGNVVGLELEQGVEQRGHACGAVEKRPPADRMRPVRPDHRVAERERQRCQLGEGLGSELVGEDDLLVVLEVDDVRTAVARHDRLAQPAHVLARRERVHEVRPVAVREHHALAGRGVGEDGERRPAEVVHRLRMHRHRDRRRDVVRLERLRDREHVERAVAREVAVADEEDVHGDAGSVR